jgi:alpha-tubulin suppressor-like RCC1 family protein
VLVKQSLPCVALVVAFASLSFGAGCLGGLESVACVTDDECGVGVCLAGACVVPEDGGGDVASDVLDDTTDVVSDVGDSGRDAETGPNALDAGDVSDVLDAADSGDASDAISTDVTDAGDASDASDASDAIDGGCETRNACGGCTTLDEVPGGVCGPCERDRLVCDGTERVVCSGSTTCDQVSLVTVEAEPITATGFSVRALLGLDADESVTDYGVCLDNEPLPTLDFDDCDRRGAATINTEFISVFDGLDPGTTYFVRAFAVTDGVEQYGNELVVLTLPEAPTGLTATQGTLTNAVELSWAPSDGADEYVVYRDTVAIGRVETTEFVDPVADAAGLPMIDLEQLRSTSDGPSSLTLTWSAAVPGRGDDHTYVVRAANLTGESSDSLSAIGYRGGPAIVQYEVTRDDGGPEPVVVTELRWTDPAPLAPTLSAGTAIASDGTSADFVSLSVTGAGAFETTANYSIRAVDESGARSESISIRAGAAIPDLTYQWARKGPAEVVFSALPGLTTASATDVPPTTGVYEYRVTVTAGSASGISVPDTGFRGVNVPSISTDGVREVTAVSATLLGSYTGTAPNRVGFCWSTFPAPNLITGGSTCRDATFATSFQLSATALSPGTTYYVRAYGERTSEGVIGYGEELVFTTSPAAPTGVVATDGTWSDRVVVSWTAAPGATSYRVLRDGSLLGETNSTSFDDRTAAAGARPSMADVTVTASLGDFPDRIRVTWSAPVRPNGASASYTVVAVNGTGESGTSSADTGFRGPQDISGYEVQRGGTASPWNPVGLVTTTDDTTAPAGSIVPGTASATDGTWVNWVRLTLAGFSRLLGAETVYRVRAVTAAGAGTPSAAARGFRGVGTLRFQWERRVDPTGWEPLDGATTQTWDDLNGLVAPSSAEYRCRLSADGAADALSAIDEGYVDDMGEIVQIASGGAHSCVVYKDGTFICWGVCGVGQCGYPGGGDIGDSPNDFPLLPISLPDPVTELALGDLHSCALTDEGNVYCWGEGDLGRLGYGNTNDLGRAAGSMPTTPVPIGGVAIDITAGRDFSCAVLTTGEVKCWGNNASGQLGNGGFDNVGDNTGEVPTTVVPSVALPISDRFFTALGVFAGGVHACALTDNEGLRCWGASPQGQICGVSGGTNRAVIVNMIADAEIADVVMGDNHTCALTSEGETACCGTGAQGQHGYGTAVSLGDSLSEIPRPLHSYNRGIAQIASGSNHTCVRVREEGVRCWGNAGNGRLGNGSSTLHLGDNSGDLPISVVPSISGVALVSAGGAHTCMVTVDNQIQCWGNGQFGRRASGNTDTIGDAAGEMPPTFSYPR